MRDDDQEDGRAPAPIQMAIPLARLGNERETREAIMRVQVALAASRAGVEAAQAQLACLELEAFFKAHPGIGAVFFNPDNGMSASPGNASLEKIKGALGPAPAKRLGKELCLIVSEWSDELAGKFFLWSEEGAGVAPIGSAVMGADRYRAWMARRERLDLLEAAPDAEDKGMRAPRL